MFTFVFACSLSSALFLSSLDFHFTPVLFQTIDNSCIPPIDEAIPSGEEGNATLSDLAVLAIVNTLYTAIISSLCHSSKQNTTTTTTHGTHPPSSVSGIFRAWRSIFFADEMLFIRLLVHLLHVSSPFSPLSFFPDEQVPPLASCSLTILHILKRGTAAVNPTRIRIALYCAQLLYFVTILSPIKVSRALSSLMLPAKISGEDVAYRYRKTHMLPAISSLYHVLPYLAALCGRKQHIGTGGGNGAILRAASDAIDIDHISPDADIPTLDTNNVFMRLTHHQFLQRWFHSIVGTLSRRRCDPSLIISPSSDLFFPSTTTSFGEDACLEPFREIENLEDSVDVVFGVYTSLLTGTEEDDENGVDNDENTSCSIALSLLQTLMATLKVTHKVLLLDGANISYPDSLPSIAHTSTVCALSDSFSSSAISTATVALLRVGMIDHNALFMLSTELLLLLHMIPRSAGPLFSRTFGLRDETKAKANLSFATSFELIQLDLDILLRDKLSVLSEQFREVLCLQNLTEGEKSTQDHAGTVIQSCGVAFVVDKFLRFSYTLNEIAARAQPDDFTFRGQFDVNVVDMSWVELYLPDYDTSLLSQAIIGILNQNQLYDQSENGANYEENDLSENTEGNIRNFLNESSIEMPSSLATSSTSKFDSKGDGLQLGSLSLLSLIREKNVGNALNQGAFSPTPFSPLRTPFPLRRDNTDEFELSNANYAGSGYGGDLKKEYSTPKKVFMQSRPNDEDEATCKEVNFNGEAIYTTIVQGFCGLLTTGAALFVSDTFVSVARSSVRRAFGPIAEIENAEEQVIFYNNDIKVLIDILLRRLQEGNFELVETLYLASVL